MLLARRGEFAPDELISRTLSSTIVARVRTYTSSRYGCCAINPLSWLTRFSLEAASVILCSTVIGKHSKPEAIDWQSCQQRLYSHEVGNTEALTSSTGLHVRRALQLVLPRLVVLPVAIWQFY
jgi:hypothetical protein